MKKFFVLFFLSSFSLFAQNSNKTCELLFKVNSIIQQEHYRAKPIDDSLSVFVFDNFMDALDSNRNLFTKLEYVQLSKHRLLLDDYIVQDNCFFMDEFVDVYQLALERKKRVLEKIENDVLDYNSKDTVKFSKESFPFDMTEANIEKIWKKRARFDILEEIAKSSTNLDSLSRNFPKLEKIAKAKIFDSYLCKVNSILNSKKGLEYDMQNDYLNIFCSYFDPHSNYFSMDAKSSFMSNLSTSNLSLGVNVSMNDKDEIVVEEVIPGGPAAQSGKLEKDDIILKVSNNKDEEYTVSCASIEKIGEMIFSDNNKEILFTIRKKDGNITDIVLRKQIMKATANAVYSYIAEKDTKVGYINIPTFYSDFEENSVQGCADDVAKEIAKLLKDNIKGLIIDLQDNGGGSMDEAIKLAGMFIDSGPVSVLADNKKKQFILRDSNRGGVYSGPIVILINGNSASASEFFTAAMQDYNRAIIVGSRSLGKASMQTIIPLDANNQQDFVKVTIQKFYRITGDSNQIKGIIPDISLPVLFDSILQRENGFKTALKYDKIITKAKFTPLPRTNFLQVINQSKERTKNSLRFNEIAILNDSINAIYNSPKAPIRITFKDVFKETHEIDPLWKKVKQTVDTETSCKIYNTTIDEEKIKSDSFEQEINNYKIKDAKTNPYIEEAVAIIKDVNDLRK